jgi:hypothetical protein
MQPQSSYQDGSYTTPLESAPPVRSWPFAANPTPDVLTRLTERTYDVDRPAYAPTLARRTSWTNLLPRSQALATAPWTATGGTVTNDAGLAPDGTLTATRFNAAAVDSLFNQVTLAAGTYTISGWLRRTGSSNQVARLKLDSTFSADLILGEMWTYHTLTVTTAATALAWQIVAGTAAASYDVLIWGAQLTPGSLPGPYIPTTTAARTISAPDLDDPAAPSYDPFAYLVAETPGEITRLNRLALRRTYARIPGVQLIPTSQAFSKPALSDSAGFNRETYPQSLIASGVISPNFAASIGATAIDAAAGVALTPENKLYSARNVTGFRLSVASGGTFTLSYNGATTAALNWNDSAATIKAAVEGLGTVSFQVTVVNSLATSGTMGFTVTLGTAPLPITMDAASLTTNAGTTTVWTNFTSSSFQSISLAHWLTSPAHGILSTDAILMDYNVNTTISGVPTTLRWVFTYPTGAFLALDANTLGIPFTGVNSASIVGKFIRAWAPGADQVRARQTETYYLPGVTAGITTADDIPLATPVSNDAQLFAEIVLGTTWVTFDTQGPAQWIGPILRTIKTEINLADL